MKPVAIKLLICLLTACFMGGCGDAKDSLTLSVGVLEAQAGAGAQSLSLWAKTAPGSAAGQSRSAQHRLEIPSDLDLSVERFDLEIEDAGALSGTMLLHLVTEDEDGRSLGWASLQLRFPQSGTIPIELFPAMAGCDIDGDGFPACELPSCCPHLDDALKRQFEDCEDDDQGDRIVPPNRTRPGMRIQADEIHPFFDPSLEQARSYWCKNGISNTCADTPPTACTYSDADLDGFPSSEVGPEGESVGPNTDCEDNQVEIHPGAEELCNGRDEDCDQEIDEGCDCQPGEVRDCYEGPPGTQGVGLCRGGQQGCGDNGSWEPCVGQRLPAVELCNDQDDNCDRLVDEGCDCRPDDVRTCGSDVGTCTLGVQVCDDEGVFTEECLNSVTPEAEDEIRCDGRDEDCDGAIDENWQINEACVGVGACGDGRWECSGPGSRRCSTHQGGSAFDPQEETCNGTDDDCDRQIDETFDLQTDINHCGQCGHSCALPHTDPLCVAANCRVLDCHPGWYDIDQRDDNGCEYGCEPTGNTEQVCDGRDDDCNGLVDESFDFQNDPAHCGGCLQECAPANGEGVCQGGTCNLVGCNEGWYDSDGDVTNGCEYECRPSGDERCNGQGDEDCDGQIDEGFAVDLECTVSVGSCASEGRLICADDGLDTRCDAAPPQPQDEICNGEDEDCDGDLDEDIPCCGNSSVDEGEGCDDENQQLCDGCEGCERRRVLNTQGGSSRVHLGNSLGRQFGRSELTIEFWVKLRSLEDEETTVLLGAGGEDLVLAIVIDEGKLSFAGPDTDDDAVSESNFPLDEWVHVAAQRRGDRLSLYQNGERVAQGSLDNGRVNWDLETALYLGRAEPPGGLDGLIDELHISSTRRYRDAEFVPARRFEPDRNTQALWHFDEGEGDVALDAADPEANTATLQNVGWTDDDGYGGRFCGAP